MALQIDAAMEDAQTVEDIEIVLLLEGIYQRYGDDFRGHDRDALRRKLHALMQEQRLRTVSALQNRVMHDRAAGEAAIRRLSLRPTALFDEPEHLAALREAVGPWLRSCAVPKIWIAECSGAEEVFSLAVLLAEEGLYDRTQIFVTGANEALLREAQAAAFPAERWAEYQNNYRRSGGARSLEDYCTIDGGQAVFKPALRRNITWAQYSLTTDSSFNEFELIVCRGALTEFGPALRRRTLRLFDESLAPFGMLSLKGVGKLETTPLAVGYKSLSLEHGLYRRTG